MRPLAASLVFIIIAMIVGVFRQLLFTNSGNNSDDSNIALTKLHTLTVAQHSDSKYSFNSLYEALYKKNQKKQSPLPLPYNSFVLKKAILNNEYVYICDEKFAAIFEQNTFCGGIDSLCKWRTIITVYRLPYFKKQQEKVIEIEGRVLNSRGTPGQLDCIKKHHPTGQDYFQLNFAVMQKSRASKKGAGWTMNSINIEEQNKNVKNSTFNLKMVKWNLKNVNHYPKLYNYDSKCLSYVTEEEPWLVHFNCGKNWSSFNVLHPKVQETLFSKVNTTQTIQPPFSTTHYVTPLYLRVFKSTLKNYAHRQSCTGIDCRQQNSIDKTFVTYVFEVVNSHYLIGSTIAQLTIAVSPKNERKQGDGLVSYDILSNELNAEKKLNFDCSIQSKNFKIIKGLYNYQLGAGSQDHTIASLSRHSLLCIVMYNYKDNLKIIQIEDLFENINMTALNIPGQLLIRSEDDLEQNKVENIVKKEVEEEKVQIQEDDDDNQWLDYFDFSLSKYTIDEAADQEQQSEEDKKGKSKNKKDDKKQDRKQQKKEERKKTKKTKKQREIQHILSRSQDQRINYKIKQINQHFQLLGSDSPFEASTKIIQFPMPFTLTSDSQFKIVNGDLQYPLIYIQTFKKYLLTYQFQEEEDSKNKSKKIVYTYKYSEIGSSIKSPDTYIRISSNQSKIFQKKDEFELDKYLLEVIPQNVDLLNQVKSIRVVDARYEQNINKYNELVGMKKPFRKQVIVAWGWGIQVYEVNWDKKGVKNQLIELEELLNFNDGGIEMLTILPFIELFATVYCLFQTLVNPR